MSPTRPARAGATGGSPGPVAVNAATHALYVGNLGDKTVSVINTATCNARTPSGCNQRPPAVKVTDSPYGLAVDPYTNTVYVANTGTEVFPPGGHANLTSSVSIINGAACNGTQTSGCGQTPRSVAVGGFPWGVAINPINHAVYVTSIVDSNIAVLNGRTCNGHHAVNCRVRLLRSRTGGWSAYLGVDTASRTLYVTDNVDGALSIFPFKRR